MSFKKISPLFLALWVGVAAAQMIEQAPDWMESDAPPPPAFSSDHLIPLDMPPYVSLNFGIDPNTLSVTADGVARYVVVATNASGTKTAMYEGIRCATGEVKTYARFNSNGKWGPVKEPKWQELTGPQPSKHASVLARQGLCEGPTTTGLTVTDIVRALKR